MLLQLPRSEAHRHSFPTLHNQVDFSYYLIALLEKAGLAWDVKRPTEAQKAKLAIKE